MVEKRKAVELLAIGIGHDVDTILRTCCHNHRCRTIGKVMMKQLAVTFDQDPRARARVMNQTRELKNE